MKIGVFDSGIGGKAIAESLAAAFPDADVLCVNDRENLPYGGRDQEDIIRLTDKAIQPLLVSRCDTVVIACNTATAAAIETLRERHPQQSFIGLEPMLKPASKLTRNGIIAVCATPATLASKRYQKLKESFAENMKIIEPDCYDWATMIEQDALSKTKINNTIDAVCRDGADVIVLACTHYHWIHHEIETAAAGRAVVINPSEAIVRRVAEVLKTR